jgi:hypothetical protein
MAVVCGIGLSACSSAGTSAARQACTHVANSISLYSRSTSATDPSTAQRLADQAALQLSDALPLAAQAAGEDNQWQALMTTVSEFGRVPESDLVPALTAQCAEADSSNADEPVPPPSVPPPDTVPPAVPPPTTAPPKG